MADTRSNDRKFYGWINLVVVGVIGVIGGFYIASFSYFMPFLIEDFGWLYGTISWGATINLMAMGFCGPVAGFFIMKFGARRAIVLGNFLGFAGFFLLYFHSYLWQLFLGQGLLVGTAAGLGGMLATTTVVNNWFVKKRSLGLGIALGTGGGGGIFMGPAIVAFINAYGWRTAYLAISLLVLVFAVIIPGILIRNKPEDLGQIPDGPAHLKNPADDRKPLKPKVSYKTPVDFTTGEAIRTRCLWLLIAYYCMNMLAMNALMAHQVNYLMDIGFSAIVASFALSVMVGLMTFSQFGTGFLGMKFNIHSIAIGAEVLKAIGIVILVSTSSYPFVLVYMVVLGLSFGAMIVTMMNILPNYFGISHYPGIMGFARLFFAIIGSFGAPIAGFIRDTTGSFLPAFQAVIVIILVGILCLALAKPPVHPSLSASQTKDPSAA
ncbi:MAG: MFS transporter [Acidobacteria bacterium]|nr:MFS transporter [Acidobacteriota bacterium]